MFIEQLKRKIFSKFHNNKSTDGFELSAGYGSKVIQKPRVSPLTYKTLFLNACGLLGWALKSLTLPERF